MDRESVNNLRNRVGIAPLLSNGFDRPFDGQEGSDKVDFGETSLRRNFSIGQLSNPSGSAIVRAVPNSFPLL
jgi:hypothetical protein